MDASTPALPVAPMAQIRFVDSGHISDTLRVILMSDGPGIAELRADEFQRIAIHVGRPVRLNCHHGTKRHSGLAMHGDIDLIPSGTTARWEMKETDTALVVKVHEQLLGEAAEHCEMRRPGEIRSQFRLRDSQLEHIAWALLAEVQRGYPSGPLYLECMGMAIAIRLLKSHSTAAEQPVLSGQGMPQHRLRQVQSYIEENLHTNLSLREIAEAVGISASHLKVTFRQATGMPVHQYVIHRRVEHASLLLRQGQLPISRIALDVGFAHQSHLAMHMKRLTGIRPSDLYRGKV